MSAWIRRKDRAPKPGSFVIVFYHNRKDGDPLRIDVAEIDSSGEVTDAGIDGYDDYEYWMPLPPEPLLVAETKPGIDRMLRRKEVEAITGRGRSAIYDGIAAGTFPKPVKIGARAVAWPESVIRAWIAERVDGAYD